MIREKLSEALKIAMKEKRTEKITTIRTILAVIKDRDISARLEKTEVNDEIIINLLRKRIKQHNEAIDAFKKGNRTDLVEKEQREIDIIEEFLPKLMSNEETLSVINAEINKIESPKAKDIGNILNILKEKYPGMIDIAKAGGLIRSIIN